MKLLIAIDSSASSEAVLSEMACRPSPDGTLEGSVSEAVAIHAPGSVEVIRSRNHFFFDRCRLMPALI